MNFIKAIRDKLASVDEVVPVLVLFEIIYLAVGQFIIWVFLPIDKPAAALGLAIGVGFAVLSSIQNSLILKGALSRGKKRRASIGMVIFMLIRIAGISLVVVLALRYRFCNAVAVLIGVLAIQVGVYFEPSFRKRRERKQATENRVERIRNRGVPDEKITDREPSSPVGDVKELYNEEQLQENIQEDAQGAEGDRGEEERLP